MLDIWVDADACPVKDEVCRVADRYELRVTFVSNSRMRVPQRPSVSLVIVRGHLDAADDWIVERVGRDDVVVTADIPLASRCLEKQAHVLRPTGQAFTDDNIGEALATRDLLADLRDTGTVTGGPPPFQPKDRSRFLQEMDRIVQSVKRRRESD